MKILIVCLLSIIFLSLAIIHIYWAFGSKKGSVAIIPTKGDSKPLIKPGLVDCLVVAIVLTAFAIFVLIKGGVIFFGLPHWLLNYGLWAIAALFIIRAIGEFNYIGFFKKIKTTRFGQMDTKYYSPLCLLIGILSVILEFVT
jgi:Protein of unknown function (DUF3995)